MIGGWPAVQVVPVSREFALTVGEQAAQEFVSSRLAGDWLIRGPRGGRYIAHAAQVTRWQVDKDGFFDRNAWRFIGHRRELRYVRPGSRDAERFEADA